MSSPTILLKQAEAADNYRKLCKENDLNWLARSNQTYAPFFEPMEPTLKALVAKTEITRACELVFLHPSADSGFPHTRPQNIICLPVGYGAHNLEETLLHEGFHVHQRNFEDSWISYSIRQGWWPIASSEIPERWRSRVRLNPDTLSNQFWIWEDRYAPLPLFTNEASPSLAAAEVRWMDRRTGTLLRTPPPSFLERYGSIAQPEHPFETGAIEFAKKNITTFKGAQDVLIFQ
jgi:hypothetical protein